VQRANFHETSFTKKITTRNKLTKWLFAKNYYLPETATVLLPGNDLNNANSTIVLPFDCYAKFPKWRLILVLVY